MRHLPLLLLFSCNPTDPGIKDSLPDTVDPTDADGDGFSAEAGDCDDADPAISPAAEESCNGVDDDCDGEADQGLLTPSWADADGDGYGDPASEAQGCGLPEGRVADSGDCDDGDPEIHPLAPERCDEVDNDCDGTTDEDVTARWYADSDGDGYGDPAAALDGCDPPGGYVADDQDCDDADPAINPDGIEVCDEQDNNCDEQTDEGVTLTFWADLDGDGWGSDALPQQGCALPAGYASGGGDCDDGAAGVNPGAIEVCDGLDNDCDGQTDEDSAADAPIWYADADGDGYGDPSNRYAACAAPPGYVADSADCDDADAAISPVGTEVCDGADNDCDGTTDEDDAADAPTWYVDGDGDGYGDARVRARSCAQPAGYVGDATDCDDGAAAANPAQVEVCDLLDNDCDGQTDEDDATDAIPWYADGDGDRYGDPGAIRAACAQPVGYVGDATDCDDRAPSTHPYAPEYCDGVDNDCDGAADEPDAINARDWYGDGDGDGYGDAGTAVTACGAPAGYVADDTDCDDGAAGVNPGAAEVCDGLDNDCDGTTDEDSAVDAPTWYIDVDGDGWGSARFPAAACSAPAGYVADATDCDDTEAAANPGEIEVCDGIDNDCDGEADEDSAADAGTWYLDADGDGYGDAGVSAVGCGAPAGYVADDTDCDDGDAAISPAAAEVADGVDNDCDGVVDDGVYFASCREIHAAVPAWASGTYAIDPDGSGGSAPFDVYCDMATDGGGWTLVAAAVDQSCFSGAICGEVCGSSPATACSEAAFTSASTCGDLATMTARDMKSAAYSSVPFTEFLFADSGGRWASYTVAAASQGSVRAWYPSGLRNYVGGGVEAHGSYNYTPRATNVPAATNACGTLRVSFNVEDSDTPMGGSCHHASRGPAWSTVNNDSCYWDDGGMPWVSGAFAQSASSTWRRWYVR